MIPSPPIQLTQVIERVQADNEKRIAAEIGIPQQQISTETALLLRHFSAFCKTRGVKSLPAAPVTIAAFVRSEAAAGVTHDQILDALAALEMLHDSQGLPNPVATAVVRAELGRILKPEMPRWNKQEQLIFCGLPPEIRAIISRHSLLDSKAVRKAQNEAAQLRNQLKAFEHKGIEQNESSIKETTV